MLDATSTILIIDDDVDLRNSLGRLLRSVGLNARLFASVSDFLKSEPTEGPSCLVLDVRLPGQSGLEFQRELAAAGRELPIIFITGYGDIPMSVQAMKSGAIEFLTKPIRDQELLDAIQSGLTRDRVRRENDIALADLRKRFATLSPRERESHDSGRAGAPEQADCRRYRYCPGHSEGPPQQSDAENECSLASRVWSNGSQAQPDVRQIGKLLVL